MNTCYQSDIPAPATLPRIGTKGFYVMPAIKTSDGIEHAAEQRYPVTVSAHIGNFGLRLTEHRPAILPSTFEYECHFTSFEPLGDFNLTMKDVAFRVNELLADTGDAFACVVAPTWDRPRICYGSANTSFRALGDAVGLDDANNIVAAARENSLPYQFDEEFGRDTYRMSDHDDNLLAILIRG